MSNGKVGIRNTNPTYDLDINANPIRFQNWTDVMLDWSGLCGSPVIYPSQQWYLQLGKQNQRIGNIYTEGIHSPNYWQDSDDSIKTNISDITNPMAIIQELKGKEYYFREIFYDGIPDSMGIRNDFTRKHFGFMARELLSVIPEIVKHDSFSDKYFVAYNEIIPFLTEAIKEQHVKINELNAKVDLQQNQIGQLESELTWWISQISDMQSNITNINEALSICCSNFQPIGGISGEKSNKPLDNASQLREIKTSAIYLYQNNPNPFDTKTEIKYYLPSEVSSVVLIISNLNGQQLTSYKNLSNKKGTHSITIDGGSLNAGSYYYTLLVNGSEVNTKKMILIK